MHGSKVLSLAAVTKRMPAATVCMSDIIQMNLLMALHMTVVTPLH